jgi:hypothetical protein
MIPAGLTHYVGSDIGRRACAFSLMVGAAEREPKVQERLASQIQFVCSDIWWPPPAGRPPEVLAGISRPRSPPHPGPDESDAGRGH